MSPTLLQILKSKTVWLGIITAAAGAVQAFAPLIPPKYVPVALVASGLVGVIVRFYTTVPLDQK